jgi:hypothetical protein
MIKSIAEMMSVLGVIIFLPLACRLDINHLMELKKGQKNSRAYYTGSQILRFGLTRK